MQIDEEHVLNFLHQLKRIGDSITPNLAGSPDATGSHVESLTAAVMGLTKAMVSISEAIYDVAEAIASLQSKSKD